MYELSMHVSHLPHSRREFIVYGDGNTKKSFRNLDRKNRGKRRT
jgi:hypothetical protein